MNFEELLKLKCPESFKDGTIYWEFTLYGINGDKSNKLFRFDDFDKFREAYIVAHEENVRRLKEKKGTLIEIGRMITSDWPTYGKDNCS